MPGLTLIVDGITLQHAGELLLGTTPTAQLRGRCTRAYIRCVEDVAFAALFAENILYVGSLPPVGGEYPGEELLRRLQRAEPLKRIGSPDRPSVYLDRDEFRSGIEKHFAHLPAANGAYPGMWGDFFVRDMHTYLGDDDSLRNPRLDPEGYRFAENVGNLRGAYYFENQPLQELIDENFVRSMVSRLRLVAPGDVVDPALSEFVKRAALTHITISDWYDVVYAAEMGEHRARLPFGTRASLWTVEAIPIGGAAEAEEEVARQKRAASIEELRRLILPHALAHAMETAENRDDLIDNMKRLWRDDRYVYLRERLGEIAEALARDDCDDAHKLADEILGYREDRFKGNETDDIGLRHYADPVAEFIRKKALIRDWVRRYPSKNYRMRLVRFFEELDPSQLQ
jgi:hypothetical protein